MRLPRVSRRLSKMIVFLLVISTLLYYTCHFQQFKLLQTHIVFRHGNRTPIATFPTDINQEDTWKEGFGELTDVGKESSFNLGSALRDRYIVKQNLIFPSYDKKTFSIISTDSNRTLGTATLVLAGLFPVDSSTAKQYPINPIPIRYIPSDINYLLKCSVEICPKLIESYAKIVSTPKFLFRIFTEEKFFLYLSNVSGWSISFINVARLYQSLVISKSYGKKLVDWATSEVIARLENIFKFKVKFFITYDDELYRRLIGGEFLYKLKTNMMDLINGKSSLRMFLYSAHDTTIEKIITALRISEFDPVPFNGALAFELYESDDKHYIQVLYRKDTKDFIPLLFPNGERILSIEEFSHMYIKIMSSSVEKECKTL